MMYQGNYHEKDLPHRKSVYCHSSETSGAFEACKKLKTSNGASVCLHSSNSSLNAGNVPNGNLYDGEYPNPYTSPVFDSSVQQSSPSYEGSMLWFPLQQTNTQTSQPRENDAQSSDPHQSAAQPTLQQNDNVQSSNLQKKSSQRSYLRDNTAPNPIPYPNTTRSSYPQPYSTQGPPVNLLQCTSQSWNSQQSMVQVLNQQQNTAKCSVIAMARRHSSEPINSVDPINSVFPKLITQISRRHNSCTQGSNAHHENTLHGSDAQHNIAQSSVLHQNVIQNSNPQRSSAPHSPLQRRIVHNSKPQLNTEQSLHLQPERTPHRHTQPHTTLTAHLKQDKEQQNRIQSSASEETQSSSLQRGATPLIRKENRQLQNLCEIQKSVNKRTEPRAESKDKTITEIILCEFIDEILKSEESLSQFDLY